MYDATSSCSLETNKMSFLMGRNDSWPTLSQGSLFGPRMCGSCDGVFVWGGGSEEIVRGLAQRSICLEASWGVAFFWGFSTGTSVGVE